MYYAAFRARQEQAKFDRRFASRSVYRTCVQRWPGTWTTEVLDPRARVRDRNSVDQFRLVSRRHGTLRQKIQNVRNHDAAKEARSRKRPLDQIRVSGLDRKNKPF
jgi:hypothetical protein